MLRCLLCTVHVVCRDVLMPLVSNTNSAQACLHAYHLSCKQESWYIYLHLTSAQFPVDWMHAHQNHHIVHRHASNLNRRQQAVHTRENLTPTRQTSIK